jgi:acyl carrier protein
MGSIVALNQELRRLEIQVALISLVRSLLQEWQIQVGDIYPESQLVSDLNFESIKIINLFVALEKKYCQTLDYSRLLMQDGHYVEDITIEQMVDFLQENLTEEELDFSQYS